jgi:hypothetical protein
MKAADSQEEMTPPGRPSDSGGRRLEDYTYTIPGTRRHPAGGRHRKDGPPPQNSTPDAGQDSKGPTLADLLPALVVPILPLSELFLFSTKMVTIIVL